MPTLSKTEIDDFKAALRGQLIMPDAVQKQSEHQTVGRRVT
jgi:hypothetical protein